jgi:uncharacterized protein (TIGR03790 family)
MTACASKFSITLLVVAAFFTAARADEPAIRQTREADATLVLFNTRDPESRSLAEYYAERRRIPATQVVGLDCPLEEEISRQQYIDTIEQPLRALFDRKEWWTLRSGPSGQREVSDNRIRFVALMRGIPLKIKTTIQPPSPEATPPPRPNGGDPIRGHDEASVDSELSILGAFRDDPFGIINNPYYRRFSPILDSSVSVGLLLVARLDAPSADTVRRMIDDTLLAERLGLYGWAYIDRRSIPESGYREGDDWLQSAAAECWNHGIPVILDNNPAILPAGFAVTDAALYYGWYDWQAGGAMGAPQFIPGAIAVHIHSFSARTLRDPNAHWAAPLLTRGAAATLGNVYEPYLDLTPHLDIFNERLLQGFTFAESAYMSLKVLSWMTTIIGDPLYRPFAAATGDSWRREPSAEAEPWLALQKPLRQAARAGLTQALYLARLARETPTGLNYEALGMLQSFYGEPREALKSLESAGTLYKNPAEAFRTIVERIRILQSIGDKSAALKLIDRTLQRAQPPDRAKLLKDIRNEIAPPPPPPSTAPKQP